jgi:CBS domain-containing protein
MSALVSASMTRVVYAVSPDTSLEVAGRLLYKKNITGAPVVDPEGRAVGVITAKDLADPDRPRASEPGTSTIYRVADGSCNQIDGGKVSTPGRATDVMTTYVVAVTPDSTLRDAMRLMTADNIHRVVVIDEHKRIVGIVSSMDVMRALLAAP